MNRYRIALLLSLFAVSITSTSCSKSNVGPDGKAIENVKLTGAGASFPAPLYDQWFNDYRKLHPNVSINYQAIGSGGGITQLTQKTVDFAASDAAMTPEEIAKVEAGVVLLPMTAGSIVLAYEVPGVTSLKLSREAYVGIFLGKITKWNDAAIAKSNPGTTLPDLKITPVYRADSSGTTFVFTQHLSTVSEDWKKGPGTSKSIDWPVGIGGKQNAGVAAAIKQTPGSIGYIEYGYMKQAQLSAAVLENKEGEFVAASTASAQAALASASMPENLIAWVPDPSGKTSYPIVTYTWLLTYKTYTDAGKAKALKDVIRYGLTEGQKVSEAIGYVPLPTEVTSKVVAALDQIKP